MSTDTKATQGEREMAIKTPLADNALVLTEFHYNDELGRPFSLTAKVAPTLPDIKPEDLLGKNVTIRLTTGPSKLRYFNGFVSRVSQSADIHNHPEFDLTIVPQLWYLTKTADCRVYQPTTPFELFQLVLGKQGITVAGTTPGVKARYEFCVQYRETDFNFVHRLMEQEGVSYFFQHTNGEHTLNLTDDTTRAAAVPDGAELEYHPPNQSPPNHRRVISSWHADSELESDGVMINDYDFTRPSSNLRSAKSVAYPHRVPKSEIYDYPTDSDVPTTLPDYVKVRAEEIASHAESYLGDTACRTLEAGFKFKLTDPTSALRKDAIKDYVVVSSSVYARQNRYEAGGGGGSEFHCSFRAVPATQHYRPARRTPKPIIAGPQTAVVVGPPGEEIHTDKYGRVLVQFHWDRYGTFNDKSSCWIRVSQVFTGKNWGAVFTPRIGEEVIVEFLEGDPDRPIITGRVYNATNMPPYALPANKTISGFKTYSSKGGGGFNELRFEDKKDSEQLFMHAQKNMDVRVKNDSFETIGHDRHLEVVNDYVAEIKNDSHLTVTRDHVEKYGRDHMLTVVGKQAVEITETMSLKVKKDVGEEFKANYSTKVTGDYFLKAKNICLEAETNVTIKVGGNHIAISSGGIKLGSTADIKIEAKGNLSAEGSAVAIEGKATAELKSKMATVDGAMTTIIKGGMVKIN